MVGFKPGDEVVCIYGGPWKMRFRNILRFIAYRRPVKGRTYTVASVHLSGVESGVGVKLKEVPSPKGLCFCSSCFRKVQRRDLAAWLATETTIEGPTRTNQPVKRKEQA